MGIKGKLFALAASAVLMLVGLAGSIYPLLAGESVSVEALSSMSIGEHDDTWSGQDAETTLADYFEFNRSTTLQLIAIGGLVSSVGVLMTNRSKRGDVTTA
jgi:hypothetical protein